MLMAMFTEAIAKTLRFCASMVLPKSEDSARGNLAGSEPADHAGVKESFQTARCCFDGSLDQSLVSRYRRCARQRRDLAICRSWFANGGDKDLWNGTLKVSSSAVDPFASKVQTHLTVALPTFQPFETRFCGAGEGLDVGRNQDLDGGAASRSERRQCGAQRSVEASLLDVATTIRGCVVGKLPLMVVRATGK